MCGEEAWLEAGLPINVTSRLRRKGGTPGPPPPKKEAPGTASHLSPTSHSSVRWSSSSQPPRRAGSRSSKEEQPSGGKASPSLSDGIAGSGRSEAVLLVAVGGRGRDGAALRLEVWDRKEWNGLSTSEPRPDNMHTMVAVTWQWRGGHRCFTPLIHTLASHPKVCTC